jgi:hypothetical protein
MAQELYKRAKIMSPARRILPHILAAALPIGLIVLYYIVRDNRELMDWVNVHITAPYRNGAAAVTSFGPFQFFSLAEILITLLVLWVVFYLLGMIVHLIRGPYRLACLGRRLFVMATVALYIFAAYSWLWGGVYDATSFSSISGLATEGVSVRQLAETTEYFAQQANRLSGEVQRDADGRFNEDPDYYFTLSRGLYANLERQYPTLRGTAYRPKAMIYSRLMSTIGFTGVYIALTGETNINTDAPGCLVPSTIAHEMAHQRGVAAEEEANFVGIAACITSKITVYEYSGYLSGLMYLSEALNKADPEAWASISATLNENVVRDWTDNSTYWSQFETGAAEAVTAMYDSYLKYNGQELGIESYGACVDLLVTWTASRIAA